MNFEPHTRVEMGLIVTMKLKTTNTRKKFISLKAMNSYEKSNTKGN